MGFLYCEFFISSPSTLIFVKFSLPSSQLLWKKLLCQNGKPVGEGGPWKNTKVKANELSDRYLMTGYDKKSLKLTADKDVKITMLLYVNHYLEEPMTYKTFEIKAGKEQEFQFPEGFSAHWVQLKSDADCNATAWFVYE